MCWCRVGRVDWVTSVVGWIISVRQGGCSATQQACGSSFPNARPAKHQQHAPIIVAGLGLWMWIRCSCVVCCKSGSALRLDKRFAVMVLCRCRAAAKAGSAGVVQTQPATTASFNCLSRSIDSTTPRAAATVRCMCSQSATKVESFVWKDESLIIAPKKALGNIWDSNIRSTAMPSHPIEIERRRGRYDDLTIYLSSMA